jgi:hypothetical protein
MVLRQRQGPSAPDSWISVSSGAWGAAVATQVKVSRGGPGHFADSSRFNLESSGSASKTLPCGTTVKVAT